MGTLNNRFQYVWYGTCSVKPCKDYLFSEIGASDLDKINTISTISDDGNTGMVAYNPTKPDEATLDRFSCGKMYTITLKPGAVGSSGVALTVPNLVSSSITSRTNLYGISSGVGICNEVSTPTPVTCTPTDYIELVGQPTQVTQYPAAGINAIVKDEGAMFAFDPTTWTRSVMPTKIEAYDETNYQVAIVNTPLLPEVGETATFYWFYDGVCNKGDMALAGNGLDYVVMLTRLWPQLAPSPTPSPVQAGAPSPTPTPAQTAVCIPSGFTKVSYSASGVTEDPFSITWPSGDVSDFAWNSADFSTGPGLAKEINIWDGPWQVIKITTDMTPPVGETPTVYWEYQGNCYSGDLAVQGDGNYTVVLTES